MDTHFVTLNQPLQSFRLVVVGTLVLALAACGRASEPEAPVAQTPAPTETPQAESPRHYEAVGVVVSFMGGKKFVNVDHEAIPGFMNAMTMPFEMKDMTLLHGIQEGDSVTFTFTVADGIQAIEKIE